MLNKSYQKILIAIILMSMVFAPLSASLKLNEANAAPVEVTASVDLPFLSDISWNTTATAANTGVLVGSNAISAGATTGSLTKTIVQFTMKLAGQMLKKLVMDRLVDAFIQYINRGYKGGIIQDWPKFWEEAKQGAVGMLAQEAGAGFLCQPFNINVQMALIPVQTFSKEMECTLDKITGNIQSFADNFLNGNWIAYQELWYPQNNYYGATLFTWNEAKMRQDTAEETAKSEGIAGGGFLSKTKCDADGKNCVVTTPGSFVGEVAKSGYIHAPLQSIISADDIAAYVTAIANAAINQLIKAGIEGIQNYAKLSTPTGVGKDPCGGTTGEEFRACRGLNNLTNLSNNMDKDYFLSQINSALEPRRQANDLLAMAIKDQTDLVNALACQITAREMELNTEQGILDDLQSKYDDNLTFLEQLEEAHQTISDSNDLIAITTSFSSIQGNIDAQTAQNFLTSVQEQQKQIQENVAAKLPALQSTMQSNCSIIASEQ